MTDTDPALDTLFLPFERALLAWPANALFLRARYGAAMRALPQEGLMCEQTFKPDADALRAHGFAVAVTAEGPHPLVLALPPRQRDEARAILARALMATAAGGRVIVCQSNNEGARSLEKDLAQIAGPLRSLSKHHCRVMWTEPLDAPHDAALTAQWSALDAPRPVADGRFMSRPGIFAWDRIDAASALLAANLPQDLHGSAADLGAGFGYLSSELLARCPRITSLALYEAESRALDLARINVKSAIPLDFHWHDVTTGLLRKYDVIVMNPPFHTGGRSERPDIGRRFIAVAAQALNPGGRLWLVANRHLPYEQELATGFAAVRTVAQQSGFKIIEARLGL